MLNNEDDLDLDYPSYKYRKKYNNIYHLVIQELVMKTHCHICDKEIQINDIFCSNSHYRKFSRYGYKSCIFYQRYGYCYDCY